MASSSPDQSTTAKTLPSSNAKHVTWPSLLITFAALVLVVIGVLWLLTSFKIIDKSWPAWLWSVLGVFFAGVGTFIKATFSDKDFQQSLRSWLTKRLFGDSGDTAKDDKAASAGTAQPITINFSSTITNTNTTAATPGNNVQVAPHIPDPSGPPVKNSAELPTPAKPVAPSEQIFFVNMRLPALHEFYGRRMEREQLLSRTRNGGCTSIIGPRRSGKTWLMSYLRLVVAEKLGSSYCHGYISATLPTIATRAGFVREALKALGQPDYALPISPDLLVLQEFVSAICAQQKTPVLCIDEFEGFTRHPGEFDLAFFEGLRAITEIGLSLIVLSKEPLIDLVSDSTKTSPFFNVFLQLKLVPFGPEEANQFVEEKAAQAQFTELDQRYCVSYSQIEREQFPPLLLQLVGNQLLGDKEAATSGKQGAYRPDDPDYWQDFKKRVDEAYSGMVKL